MRLLIRRVYQLLRCLLGSRESVVVGDEPPEALRRLASEHARLRDVEYQRSRECYSRGDHSGAKRHSEEAKRQGELMKTLNKQAADLAFQENNNSLASNDRYRLDLHGLFVKEALERLDKRLCEWLRETKTKQRQPLCFIVGKGNRSVGGKARIKPAVEQELRRRQLCFQLDPSNEGCFIIYPPNYTNNTCNIL
jgi:DNA-nicking Smr family endonuclease